MTSEDFLLSLIETHKLSVVHSALDEPEVEQKWHVISPFINKDIQRFSSSNANLQVAVFDVVNQIESQLG